MHQNLVFRLAARRLFILFIISIAIVWGVSEVAFLLQKEAYDRPPKVIELVIPGGTADRIAAGQPVPAIPEEMVFVVGDTLVIHNADRIDHELGPLWVPTGTSASLNLDQASKMAYSCTFQTSRYLDLDVRQPTTWQTRVTAIALAAPATTMFIFVYSLVIRPIQPKNKPAGESVSLAK
ncbi:MAG: hypothetical protein A2Z16_10880 [Chloroflexi bacterium RBG_16_54_18]|nr:MAG: hypothetical protein A2Z16_10880 [Chloroflexi bacterium RBG_16_54_18]